MSSVTRNSPLRGFESRDTLHSVSQPGLDVHVRMAQGIMSLSTSAQAWELLLVWKVQSSMSPISGGILGLENAGVGEIVEEVDEGGDFGVVAFSEGAFDVADDTSKVVVFTCHLFLSCGSTALRKYTIPDPQTQGGRA